MTLPDLGWKDLLVALGSAFIGWLANALKVWQTPRRKG
jgi:hypothetical protein